MTQTEHAEIVALCAAAKRAAKTDRNKAFALYSEADRKLREHGAPVPLKGSPWEAAHKLGVFTGPRCYGW